MWKVILVNVGGEINPNVTDWVRVAQTGCKEAGYTPQVVETVQEGVKAALSDSQVVACVFFSIDHVVVAANLARQCQQMKRGRVVLITGNPRLAVLPKVQYSREGHKALWKALREK